MSSRLTELILPMLSETTLNTAPLPETELIVTTFGSEVLFELFLINEISAIPPEVDFELVL